jgi:hypothetical protein
MTQIRADQWRAWGSSLILHLALLLSLTALVSQQESVPNWTSVIETRIESDPGLPSEPFTPPVNLAEFLNDSGSPAVGSLLDQQPISGSIAAGLPAGVGLSGPIGQLSGEGGLGSGGLGGPGSAETGVGFFGTRGSAKSVVFVVDMSGSMDNGRLGRAQQELVRSIHKLHVTQYFYVIFFNDRAVPMFYPTPARDLVPATPLMKRKVTRWINERRAGQDTEPEEALVMALSFKPNVIYVLTDGEFPPNCREIIKEKNTSGTIINTIALQSREGIPLLEQIASDNNGEFLFVK